MGHGLHQRGVGVEDALQEIARVSGSSRTEDLHPRAAFCEALAKLLQHGDGVGHRVALREPVGAGQHVSAARKADRLGRGRAAVDAQEYLNGIGAGAHVDWLRGRTRGGVLPEKFVQFGFAAGQSAACRSCRSARRGGLQSALQRGAAQVLADLGGLGASILDGADSGKILGVLRYQDQLVGADSGWHGHLFVLPQAVQMVTPGLAQTGEKEVGAAQEKRLGMQQVSAGQHVRFCSTMASNSEAISCSGRNALLLQPVMSVSAKTPHLPATGCSSIPS